MRNRATKILATLGPASSSRDVITSLVRAGADFFRLNFSHGTHRDHVDRLNMIREIEEELGEPIGVLLDLQGPKLRVGNFGGSSVELKVGGRFVFDLNSELGDESRVCLPHPEIFKAMSKGDVLLVDDGKMRFRIIEANKEELVAEALTNGFISDHKGVNVPGVILDLPALTEKDRNDLELALSLDVDWIALSFVQRAGDVEQVQKVIDGRSLLMSKIEKPAALKDIERIIQVSNGIMVARGDMGVELPPEKVPAVQKLLIRKCREAGKPVVIATQMLESMIKSPTPTRAEASDIATAVYDGVDAVMLSAESAAGDFPIEAVSIMDRIISSTESDPLHQLQMSSLAPEYDSKDATDAIGAAISKVAQILPISATITYTTTGRAARRVSRLRPRSPIVAVTPSRKVARQLVMYWGITSVLSPTAADVEEIVSTAVKVAKDLKLFADDKPLLVCAGIPLGRPGATNLMRIVWNHLNH